MRTPHRRLPANARRGVIILVPVVLAAAAARRIRIGAGMRRRDQTVIDTKRARNKRLANRLVTTVGRAGRRHSIFGVIHVIGRRSGRHYSTPIRLVEHNGGFLVPLTYGPRTGWYVNLRARPGQLQWQGREFTVGNPILVPAGAVTREFPPPSRFLMWLDGTDTCVRIERVAPAA